MNSIPHQIEIKFGISLHFSIIFLLFTYSKADNRILSYLTLHPLLLHLHLPDGEAHRQPRLPPTRPPHHHERSHLQSDPSHRHLLRRHQVFLHGHISSSVKQNRDNVSTVSLNFFWCTKNVKKMNGKTLTLLFTLTPKFSSIRSRSSSSR